MTKKEEDLIFDNEDKRHRPAQEQELIVEALAREEEEDPWIEFEMEEPSEQTQKNVRTVNRIIDAILAALKEERGLKKGGKK